MKPRLVLAALLLASACGSPTGPSPLQKFEAARAQWESQGIVSYRFEVTRSCFCVLGGQTMEVEVVGGVVTSAEYQDSGAGIESELVSYIPTIADLFDLIKDALDRPMARFYATYDPALGYPTRIELDYAANAIDDESTTVIRNLTELRGAEAVR